jgi:energy-coupling factor transporter ATP-binding protein EcfA2
VLLGANGTGKSTLLQAMAIALVGPLTGQRLLYNLAGWARVQSTTGEIRAHILSRPHDSAIGQPRKKPYVAAFAVVGPSEVTIEGERYDQPQLVQLKGDRAGLAKGPYAANRPWLSIVRQLFRKPGKYARLVRTALAKVPEINDWCQAWL